MALSVVRSIVGCGIVAAFGAIAPAAATEITIPRAQVTPLTFSALDGWNDDDHAAAFGAFLKSCSAILQGTKAMRAARPIYGALFNVCERAVVAGSLDRDKAR